MSDIEVAREWVELAGDRVVFVLGAGASKPALPVSSELTQIVFESIDRAISDFAAESRVPQLWLAIRPVLAEMGSNIEDVYQAIETLTYQISDPTRHWVTGFAAFENYDGGGSAKLVQDAQWILDMVQSHSLTALDEAQEAAPLEHFKSLLQRPMIGIVTLNYDQLVERAGEQFGIPVSTGADLWPGGIQWHFEPGSVPLLKLHGSMTWRGSRSLNHESGNLVPATGFYEVSGLNEPAPNNLVTPTVIFGSGSKNNPHSAFPALTRQFQDWLEQTDLLVIIGYSFRDEHVDAAIRRWTSLSPSRRMIVIDPYPRRDNALLDDVLSELLWAMDPMYRPTNWDKASAASAAGVQRIIFLTDGVDRKLPELLS